MALASSKGAFKKPERLKKEQQLLVRQAVGVFCEAAAQTQEAYQTSIRMGVKIIQLTGYVMLNVLSSTCIVFANKVQAVAFLMLLQPCTPGPETLRMPTCWLQMVMTSYGFHFPYALMLLVRA